IRHLLAKSPEGGPLPADQGINGKVDPMAGWDNRATMISTDLSGSEGITAGQWADPTESVNNGGPVPQARDGGENLANGLQDVVHLIFLTKCCFGIRNRDVRGTRNHFPVKGIKDADTPVRVGKIEHLSLGRGQ